MPELQFDGRKASEVHFDGKKAKEVYFDGRLVHRGEFLLEITGHNHNVDQDWVWRHLNAMGGGEATNIRIKVLSGVQLVTQTPSLRGVFDFYGAWNGRVITIENHGYVLGRGGNGGNEGQTGGTGGTAIYTDGNQTVNIENYGIIGSGGGGGGGSYLGASYGGGGGAPFAGGGWGSGASGPGATFDTPGSGTSWAGRVAGAGGAWGRNGEGGNGGGGGAAGAATRGPINWINYGDIRGDRV